ncbi:hypothetical protein [Actinomadura macrotermitis]|uniref:Tetratricopeptide repeat protein n=1 Tax=Actinomadura macrotermitis TaxID=2585200 RepID=A0A7K0BY74_9ACTN|nr:hypothetical protein [Actinomadura macrotermitis]MQY06141.1 hypothetical protein [Actinomadura macrotermitis]
MEQGAVPPQGRRSTDEVPPGPALAERMRMVPAGERCAVLVEHFRESASSPSLDWIAGLAACSEEFGLTVPEIRRVASDLGWVARLAERRYPGELEWGLARGVAGSRRHRLVLTYVHGQRLRYDFRFRELLERSNAWLAEFHDDALVLGFAAFGALGSRALNGLDLYNRAVAAPDADDKSRQLCLNAIWFADHVPGSPELLIDLSEELMARGEINENVHYRRASAFRRLGRFDEALTEIDLAIDRFGVGNILVHEQYAQERRTILNARDVRRQAEEITGELGERISARVDERVGEAAEALQARIDEAAAQMAQKMAVAQQMVSDGLLKMVEVLGLFVTLLGFLIGSGTVVVKAKTFDERATAMGLVTAGALVFFLLLRLTIGLRRKHRAAG